MSTDWNQKLAWALRDLPDSNLDLLQLSTHRKALLESADVALDVGPRSDWLSCSVDRVYFPQGPSASRVQVDWEARPEVTHPIAKQRFQSARVDIQASRNALAKLVDECAARFDRDPRRTALWVWRYLPERLAEVVDGPGAIAALFPADQRLPNLSVWQRIAFDMALASAFPSPTFLVIQICPSDASVGEAASADDFWAAASISNDLTWQAIRPIVDSLGPASILTPSLRYHPVVDVWLAEQGVTHSEGCSERRSLESVASIFPSSIVALVPAEQAKELGELCRASFSEAKAKLVRSVRESLEAQQWDGDERLSKGWSDLWSRQALRSWEAQWTAVAWADDSTLAGSLLPKQDITSFEKLATLHENAAGAEDPWHGVFYGLWLSAALAASNARVGVQSPSVVAEPTPVCSACGTRQALHDPSRSDASSVDAFWKSVWGAGGKSAGVVRQGEALCAECVLRRMARPSGIVSVPSRYRSITDGEDGYALVLMSLDNPQALMRGGKDMKQAATLSDCLHSELEKTFSKRTPAPLKEILGSPAYLAPARHLGVQEALDGYVNALLPLLDQHEAFAVRVLNNEVLAVARPSHAYSLAKAVRAVQQEAFMELSTPCGKRLALGPSALATCSAVVSVVPRGAAPGLYYNDCLTLLQNVARRFLGGDSIVIVKKSPVQESQVFASHWSDLGSSLDTLLRLVPSQRDLDCLTRELAVIVPALSNTDLDKYSPMARVSLVLSIIDELGLCLSVSESCPDVCGFDGVSGGGSGLVESRDDGKSASRNRLDSRAGRRDSGGKAECGAENDRLAVARAVCQIVDHCAKLPFGVQESHALDGLVVAASLCGADQ